MEKRDYFEVMIEQMGLFLKKLVSDLVHDVGKENAEVAIDSVEELFAKEFHISIDTLLHLSESEFTNFIMELKLKDSHLDDFSKLFSKCLFRIQYQLLKKRY